MRLFHRKKKKEDDEGLYESMICIKRYEISKYATGGYYIDDKSFNRPKTIVKVDTKNKELDKILINLNMKLIELTEKGTDISNITLEIEED